MKEYRLISFSGGEKPQEYHIVWASLDWSPLMATSLPPARNKWPYIALLFVLIHWVQMYLLTFYKEKRYRQSFIGKISYYNWNLTNLLVYLSFAPAIITPYFQLFWAGGSSILKWNTKRTNIKLLFTSY